MSACGPAKWGRLLAATPVISVVGEDLLGECQRSTLCGTPILSRDGQEPVWSKLVLLLGHPLYLPSAEILGTTWVTKALRELFLRNIGIEKWLSGLTRS